MILLTVLLSLLKHVQDLSLVGVIKTETDNSDSSIQDITVSSNYVDNETIDFACLSWVYCAG